MVRVCYSLPYPAWLSCVWCVYMSDMSACAPSVASVGVRVVADSEDIPVSDSVSKVTIALL